MVHVAREAAETLEKEGISIEIVDLRTRLSTRSGAGERAEDFQGDAAA